MDNTAVRKEIVEQHSKLRKLCKRLRQLARSSEDTLTRGEKDHALKAKLEELWTDLDEHMRAEDEHLLPALERVDAWGAERAAEFRRGHEDQRLLFASLRRFDGSGAELVDHVESFVALLLADMAEEETNFLNKRLMSDLPQILDDQVDG